MAVTINGSQISTKVSWGARESMTQSTATAFRSLSVTKEVSVLGMGTATGFARNLYSLPTTGVEGSEKLIVSSATGEAYVFVPTRSGRMSPAASLLAVSTATSVDAMWASATGMWKFVADGDWLLCKMINGTWEVLAGDGVTMATAT